MPSSLNKEEVSNDATVAMILQKIVETLDVLQSRVIQLEQNPARPGPVRPCPALPVQLCPARLNPARPGLTRILE